jgi:hypothetical protein
MFLLKASLALRDTPRTGNPEAVAAAAIAASHRTATQMAAAAAEGSRTSQDMGGRKTVCIRSAQCKDRAAWAYVYPRFDLRVSAEQVCNYRYYDGFSRAS